jgi:hypothetical protein
MEEDEKMQRKMCSACTCQGWNCWIWDCPMCPLIISAASFFVLVSNGEPFGSSWRRFMALTTLVAVSGLPDCLQTSISSLAVVLPSIFPCRSSFLCSPPLPFCAPPRCLAAPFTGAEGGAGAGGAPLLMRPSLTSPPLPACSACVEKYSPSLAASARERHSHVDDSPPNRPAGFLCAARGPALPPGSSSDSTGTGRRCCHGFLLLCPLATPANDNASSQLPEAPDRLLIHALTIPWICESPMPSSSSGSLPLP